MNILGTDTYRSRLAEELENSEKSITLISAYLTIEGINWILNKIPQGIKCRVLSRWNCNELVNGASDIEVYEELYKREFPLHILPDLHAKVTIIDKETLFLGSANITNSGLRLVPGGNKELGTILKPDVEDLELVEALFNESTLVTKELYEDFYNELQDLKKGLPKSASNPKWSKELQNKLLKPPTRLWVAETLWCESPEILLSNLNSKEAIHDLSLLGLNPSDTLNKFELQKAFLSCRIWKWLNNILLNTENGEIYFGELSENLHNSFLDDPTPYRKTIKGLLSNLLQWITSLGNDFVEIDRPNYSQRIRKK